MCRKVYEGPLLSLFQRTKGNNITNLLSITLVRLLQQQIYAVISSSNKLPQKKRKKKRTCYTAHLANKCLKLTLGLNNLQFIVKRSREKTEDEEMRKETKTVPTPKIVWHHELLILCGVTTRASRVFVHLFWSYAEDSFIRFLVHGHDNRLGHRAHPAVILHFGPLGLGLS